MRLQINGEMCEFYSPWSGPEKNHNILLGTSSKPKQVIVVFGCLFYSMIHDMWVLFYFWQLEFQLLLRNQTLETISVLQHGYTCREYCSRHMLRNFVCLRHQHIFNLYLVFISCMLFALLLCNSQ